MSRLLAFLLPVAASVAIAAALGVTLLLRQQPAATRPVDATPATAARPSPDSNVCQSLLRRPDPSQPRTYPALYTKISTEKGIAILADAKVSDTAIAEAHATIARMFESNTLAEALAAEGAYVVIADSTQSILDLPEFGCLTGGAAAQVGHACGVADRADYPVATVNELDLLGDRTGPCQGLNILFHELGHLVQGWAMAPADYFDVKIAYQAALDSGKYRNQYARTNSNEYFAEATQAFFLHVDPRAGRDRAWLKAYDPGVYAILARVYNEP